MLTSGNVMVTSWNESENHINIMECHVNIMECHANKHHHGRIMEIKHLMIIDMDMATSWKVEIIMSTSWKESLGNMEEESHMGWKPPWKVP